MSRLGFLRSPAALLIAAWVVYLIYLSSTPRLLLAPSLPRPVISAAAHIMAYAVLAPLIYMALAQGRRGLSAGLRSAAAAMMIATTIGFMVEGLQDFLPDRSAELLDVLFNVLGALVGLVAVLALHAVGLSKRLLYVCVGSVMLLVIAGVSASTAIWNPAYPYVGDHWHSAYVISVCGVRQPDLPGAPGGVHSHGTDIMHFHPNSPSEAGKNATLGLVFRNSGAEITRTSITLPGGASYRNGDLCPDGRAGELAVFANRVRVKDPANYVPGNVELIVFMFRAVGSGDQV